MVASSSEPAVSTLRLRLFGPFEAQVNGEPLARLRSRKGAWLLALLALRHDRDVERSWLAGTLWPDSSEPDALISLRTSLKDLRRALGPEAHRLRSPTPRTLCLELGGADVDLVAFDAAIARGDCASLEEAVGLYRAPLLEGCGEEWVLQERQVREQAYLGALEKLAAEAVQQGHYEVAERHLRLAVGVDPFRESAQRALMRALGESGNYAAAFQLYRELRLSLHRELRAEPDAETRELFEQIRAEARRRAKAPPRAADRDLQPTSGIASLLSAAGEGTLTFLFTDIEGSTKLWERDPAAMREALARHDALLRAAMEGHGGTVFKTVGDQFCAAFDTAPEALAAAVTAQRALLNFGFRISDFGLGPTTDDRRLTIDQSQRAAEPLSSVVENPKSEIRNPTLIRVRMAVHTGAVEARDGDYFGTPLNRIRRMLDVGHGGQILLSQPAADLARDLLPEGISLRDLGECRLQDLDQPERIFQPVSPDLPDEFPPLRSLDTLPNNLPLQLTSFIGREQQMAEVKQFLSTTRLLTLTGSGGCGKTRLALQVAADLLEEYADGVWLVELAALADPTLVPQSVASVLGVREQPARPLTETLVEYLKPKALLLVLDNCEHLLTACAQLTDALLRSCPSLRILASSREGLGIAGERTYRVPSLSLPQPHLLPPVERLMEYEAVRLFVERAVFTQPSFAITDQNARAVVQVCERLDGIPLAIELAAARMKALSVEKLNERLDDMFRLLTGGSRTALPRQQTLRALIDWSYDLLSPSEKALLRRLSVFAGGLTLEAAEAVCVGEGVEEWEVLDLLTYLVEKSLVRYEEREEEARYRLLESVRQYSRDRLLGSGEGETVRGRHRNFFLQLAEEAESAGRVGEATEWLDRLEEDHDNLLAALEWCRRGESERALRLAGALGWFWHSRGYWNEGREWLEQTLVRAESTAPTVERAKVLDGAGRLALHQGDYTTARIRLEESAALYRVLGDARGLVPVMRGLADVLGRQGHPAEKRALLEEGVALCRSVGDPRLLASLLKDLGGFESGEGDLRTARALMEESLALARQSGDKETLAAVLRGLGSLAKSQGDGEAARVLYEQSVSVSRVAKDRAGIGWTLLLLGDVLFGQGNDQDAMPVIEECLALGRELGNVVLMNYALASLAAHSPSYYEEALQFAHQMDNRGEAIHVLGRVGHLARERGDYQQAARLYQQSLALRQELGHPYAIAQSLEDFAGLAARQQQWLRAARLLGAAEKVCADIGAAPPVAVAEEYERATRGARAALGEEAFAAAWVEGRVMTPEQAAAYAMEAAADG